MGKLNKSALRGPVPAVLILWLCPFVPAQAAPAKVSASTLPPVAAPAPTVRRLQDDPALQDRITVESTDQPLGDLLTELSPQVKADLTASRHIADQRVTLHVTEEPLYIVMGRLIALLSHAADRPHGYHWESLDRLANARPAFRLWRDAASIAEEAAEIDYPRREVAILLRDKRNWARMSPEERKNYKGDDPYTGPPNRPVGLYDQALKGQSDTQIDALMRGEHISLDPALFIEQIALFTQQQIDATAANRDNLIRQGFPDPYPNGIPATPPLAPAIYVSPADSDGEELSSSHRYGVHLEGIADDYLVLDPCDTANNRDPGRLGATQAASRSGPVIDLAPLLADKAVTPEQRGDVGFTLQALAKTAHLTLYHEAFLRPPNAHGFGLRSEGLKRLQGTLPELIAAICAEWNMQVQKGGDDYLFWSRTWAQDRTTDVPERLIIPWKKRYEAQGRLTLDDRAEIAATLTYPQIKLALEMAWPPSGPWDQGIHQYRALRVLGFMTPSERQAAFSESGLALADMRPWEQQSFAHDFETRLNENRVSGDQFNRAVLTFRTSDDALPPQPPLPPSRTQTVSGPIQRVLMRITADGKTLVAVGFSFSLAKAPSASDRTAGGQTPVK